MPKPAGRHQLGHQRLDVLAILDLRDQVLGILVLFLRFVDEIVIAGGLAERGIEDLFLDCWVMSGSVLKVGVAKVTSRARRRKPSSNRGRCSQRPTGPERPRVPAQTPGHGRRRFPPQLTNLKCHRPRRF